MAKNVYHDINFDWFWTDSECPSVIHGPFANEDAAYDDAKEFIEMQRERVSAIARVTHELNRAFCRALGDLSQPVWEEAPEWQRSSAIAGVFFHIENPDAGDDASHNSWMEQKRADGWIYGKVKDPEASPPTHPCMVAFEELPPEQQLKDKLFRTTVHNLWTLPVPLSQ